MSVINQPFDNAKIEKLKNFLEDMAAKGQPRPYEIYVDNLRVVPKTENPDDFEGYEQYMDGNTAQLKIVIFGSSASPRNEKYCFDVQKEKEKPLNGLGEVDSLIQDRLDARDREHAMADLNKELSATKQQLEESEEYAESLEQQIQDLKEGKYKKNIQWGELASVAVESMLRRNAQLFAKIPGGEALAGLIEQDNLEKKQLAVSGSPDSKASFQKKPDAAAHLTPEHLQYIPMIEQLYKDFDDAQFQTVIQIIGKFTEDPGQLQTVAELLNIQTPSL
jgi:hypothetical protein